MKGPLRGVVVVVVVWRLQRQRQRQTEGGIVIVQIDIDMMKGSGQHPSNMRSLYERTLTTITITRPLFEIENERGYSYSF